MVAVEPSPGIDNGASLDGDTAAGLGGGGGCRKALGAAAATALVSGNT
jgi:hypothetical protein